MRENKFTDAVSDFLVKFLPDKVDRMLAIGSPIDFPFISNLCYFAGKFIYLKIGDEPLTYPEICFVTEHSNMQIVEGNLESLPFDAESFDLIFLYEVLYRVENPERLVQNAKFLLKLNGQLVAIEANWRCPYTFMVNLMDKSKRRLYTLGPHSFKKFFSCLDEISIKTDSSIFHDGHSKLFTDICHFMDNLPMFLKNILAPRYVIKGGRLC